MGSSKAMFIELLEVETVVQRGSRVASAGLKHLVEACTIVLG